MPGRELAVHRQRHRWINSSTILIAAVVGLVAFLSLYPISWLIFGSVWSSTPGLPGEITVRHYGKVIFDAETYTALLNGLVFSLGGAVLPIFISLPMAWFFTRTDIPYKRFFELGALLPFMIPSTIFVIGWIYLLHPSIGFINVQLMSLLGLTEAPFNIYSMAGMIWVSSLYNVPLAYLLLSAPLRTMDPSLEESIRVTGGSVLDVIRHATLPLLKAALIATFALNLVRQLESFDVPALLGLPTRTFVPVTLIYRSMVDVPPGYGRATAYAMILLVITLFLVYLYRFFTRRAERFVTLTGKAQRPSIVKLGKFKYVAIAFCGAYFVMGAILPMMMLVSGSLMRRFQVPSLEALMGSSLDHYITVIGYSSKVQSGFINTIFLAVFGATVGMLLAVFVAYISLRTKSRGRGLLEGISFLPFSFPGIVIAVGLIWGYASLPIIDIYGTVWILMVAYITRFMPFGLRAASTSLLQIHKELEEAARTHGSSWIDNFRTVVLPLIKPGFMAGWLFLAMVFLKELGTSVLLSGPGNPVLSVLIFHMLANNEWEALSALGVILTLMTITLTMLALRISNTGLRISV